MSRRAVRMLGGLALLVAVVAGCDQRPTSKPTASSPVVFRDVSEELGVQPEHYSGARGKKFMPETVGSGCALLDYNGDGWFDLFFLNGTDWPGPGAKPHYPMLYRNLQGKGFEDVTEAAGLRREMYGMGAAVADFDNDGDSDLFLSCLGPNFLYRNNGDGTFTDVTGKAGVAGDPVDLGGLRWKWSASACWLDYDRDGWLDLYVGNYVKWTPKHDPWCGENGKKAYCPPTSFEGVPSLLYRNRGDGTFENVSQASGIGKHIGKSFGVAAADFNSDGWVDLAVSNDTMENFFFENARGKEFSEKGLESGIALSPAGLARAGMGIDLADWENNGRFGLLIGNFSREGLALYQNDGAGNFKDVSYDAGLGESSLLSLTFGLFFFDFNLDGRQDVFAANGHIDDFVQQSDAMVGYEQVPLLYRGLGGGKFEEVGSQSGAPLTVRRVLRGSAYGDTDNDGDPDIAVVWNNRRGEVWRNEGGSQNHWIGLQLRGTTSNRDGIGSILKLKAGDHQQSICRKSGGSFLSESDSRCVFGLGHRDRAESLVVLWPSGTKSHFTNVQAGRYYRVTEGDSQLQPLP